MSNIDKRALREAAETALPAMKRLLMMPNDELFDEALLNVDGDVDAANAFNLLAGPETMLALLDELEAAKQGSAKWFKAFEKAVSVGARYEERIAEQQRSLDHREFLLLSADQVQREYAEALGCAGDNESILGAIDDMKKRIAELRDWNAGLAQESFTHQQRIAELEAKLQTADKLQDSAFRHGLQHGFSYGQTNDQAGFEQCLAAYSSRGKDNG